MRAAAALLQARRRGQGHRRSFSTPRPPRSRATQRVEGVVLKDGRVIAGRSRRHRGRHPRRTPSWRRAPGSRSAAASSSTTRMQTGTRRHLRHRRMRRASRHLLRPGRAGLRAGRACWPRISRGGDARYDGSVLATNLKVSGVSVFSAGDFIGARRHRADRAQRSRPRHLQEARHRATTGSPARCCSAIPPTALWYLDLIRTGAPIDADPRRPDVRPRAGRTRAQREMAA